ncbi:hypothetical protein, partial, partial [Parasitella parasitica]
LNMSNFASSSRSYAQVAKTPAPKPADSCKRRASPVLEASRKRVTRSRSFEHIHISESSENESETEEFPPLPAPLPARSHIQVMAPRRRRIIKPDSSEESSSDVSSEYFSAESDFERNSWTTNARHADSCIGYNATSVIIERSPSPVANTNATFETEYSSSASAPVDYPAQRSSFSPDNHDYVRGASNASSSDNASILSTLTDTSRVSRTLNRRARAGNIQDIHMHQAGIQPYIQPLSRGASNTHASSGASFSRGASVSPPLSTNSIIPSSHFAPTN